VPASVANDNPDILIFPRHKAGEKGTDHPVRGRSPLAVSLQLIQSKFSLPQSEAAISLGISRTALKQVCRRLCVQSWPYRRKKEPAAAHVLQPTSTVAALKEVLEELCAPSDAAGVSQEEAALAGLEQFYGLHGYDDDLAWLVQMDPQSLAKKDALSICFRGNSENAPSILMHLDSWMSSYTQASEELNSENLIMSNPMSNICNIQVQAGTAGTAHAKSRMIGILEY
jgi:hypothetical protein